MTRAAAVGLDIRPMVDGEETSVIGLWQSCGLTRPWNDPAGDLAFARGKPGSDVLVGLVDGVIVASCMVGHDGHRGVAYYVSVDPAYRGQGFGEAIMSAAEAWLLDRGVWKVNLMVRRGNEAVIGFYRSLGYDESAVAVIEKWIDPSKRGGGAGDAA